MTVQPLSSDLTPWARAHPRAARIIVRAAIKLWSIWIWLFWTTFLVAAIAQLATGAASSILVHLFTAGIAWGFTRRLHAPIIDARRRGVPFPC